MGRIHVMVNGLPGRMARAVAEGVLEHPDQFNLVPYSLTGVDVGKSEEKVGGQTVRLVPPAERPACCEWAVDGQPFVAVDFTVPSAVDENVDFYCQKGLPFVLGTTGGDYGAVQRRVARSEVCGIAAPNMSIPILLLVSAFDYLARRFPGALGGWQGEIVESHQAAKRDTSGTAKLMIDYLGQLGIPIDIDRITKIRDAEFQRKQLDVPEKYLGGHAYHTYTLRSPERTVELELTHKVLGRQTYVQGTLAAVRFVAARFAEGVQGRTYSMIEVLEAGGANHGW